MTEESEPVTVNFEQELETLTQFVANTKLLYETVPQKQSEKEQAGSIPRKQAPRLSIIDDILMELEDTVSQLGDIYSVPVTIVLYGGSGSGKSVLAYVFILLCRVVLFTYFVQEYHLWSEGICSEPVQSKLHSVCNVSYCR